MFLIEISSRSHPLFVFYSFWCEQSKFPRYRENSKENTKIQNFARAARALRARGFLLYSTIHSVQ
jgi:hypothetical protein